MATITVAVDANGADLGPAEVAEGALLAVEASPDIAVRLFGPAELLRPVVGDHPRISVVDAPRSIAKEPDPAAAVRAHPEASIVQAAKAVGAGDAHALVSGGSTGAALAAGLFNIKRDRGIHRPALAVPLPIPGRTLTFLDVGANTEVRVEHLVQFAFMGAALSTGVLGVARPRVGLLANGEEATKGTPLVRGANATLSGVPGLDFVGNVEGTDLAAGAVDVVVSDGFTGNVALKTIEGTSQATMGMIRGAVTSSWRGKLGGLLLRPALREVRDTIDPEGFGGAYLLGLRSLGVTPHGRFSRTGFARAIALAAKGVEEDVVGRTHAALEAAGALRRAPSAPTPSVNLP